jgi:7-cyano-7-deazaguanine synthase
MEADTRRAVVLLSGGLDSTTVAAEVRSRGFEIYALSFDYGQRHRFELEAAARVASWVGAKRHEVVSVDLRAFGGSALTDDIDVPKSDALDEDGGIPVTYVPARNTVFLSFALAWAEVLGSKDIFIGVNALDYSGYPDCRPEFIEAYQKMARLATKAGVGEERPLAIHTPLIDLSKAEIISMGLRHGVDYGMTTSCYDPSEDGRPCGRCDSCHLRLKGFAEADAKDPLHYMTEVSP